MSPYSKAISRRSMVRAGALGLMGLGMNQVGSWRSMAQAAGTQPGPAKSVIYIFLSGGLAQHESFDMKPEAPSEIRGEFQSIRTRTPGIHVCEHLPELAKRSELWALCRSLTHGSNDHSAGHHIMLTGRSELPVGFDPTKPKDSDWPSIAAQANRFGRSRGPLPNAVVLPEKLVHSTGRVIPGQFAGLMGKRDEPWVLECSKFDAEGYGAYPEYLFHHRDGAKDAKSRMFRAPNLSVPEWLGAERLQDRVGLTRELDRQREWLGRAAESGGFDRYWQLAVSLLTDGKLNSAFDVTSADVRQQERYGKNSFGWSLMMAARLVEAGVSLVQVNLGNDETWDTHEAAFPNLKNYLLPPMDRAVSALLDDLKDRGLLESTLVVMAGEFGRSPKITTIPGARLPGRDHWGAVQTAFFAGGGVGGGRVIGASDNLGAYPIADPQRPENFAATLFHALGLPESAAWEDVQGRPYPLYQASPIKGLFTA